MDVALLDIHCKVAQIPHKIHTNYNDVKLGKLTFEPKKGRYPHHNWWETMVSKSYDVVPTL